MNEVKTPKKPLIYYYSIVMLVLLLMNLFITPLLQQARIKDVDYGTFMTMTENKEIDQVEPHCQSTCLYGLQCTEAKG